MNPGRSIKKYLKWSWKDGVMFTGGNAGRNKMITLEKQDHV